MRLESRPCFGVAWFTDAVRIRDAMLVGYWKIKKGRCEVSEESLPELMWKLRQQSPGTAKHYSLAELVNARIRRAETAEKAMESWLAWCDIGHVDGTWDAFAKAVADYKAAKEAVRKLEGQT